MSWTYQQATGVLLDHLGRVKGLGYSGSPAGKNDPAQQFVHDVGPIPQGLYTIGAPEDTEAPGPHGPYVLRLTPDPANDMRGRTGFLIHGDSVRAPGTASKGCVILQRPVREGIWESGDHTLQVVSGMKAA